MLYDHLDLRVRSLAAAKGFYDALLPALGFSKIRGDEGSVTYYHASGDRSLPFFGIIEDASHVPNGTRTALAARDRDEVDRIARLARDNGAREFEAAQLCEDYSPTYYAAFFEDPDGNKFEVCCRTQPA